MKPKARVQEQESSLGSRQHSLLYLWLGTLLIYLMDSPVDICLINPFNYTQNHKSEDRNSVLFISVSTAEYSIWQIYIKLSKLCSFYYCGANLHIIYNNHKSIILDRTAKQHSRWSQGCEDWGKRPRLWGPSPLTNFMHQASS